MLDIIIDTVIDSVKLVPFLFIAFLFIEMLEHRFNNHTKELIKKSGKFGSLLGAILGAFPQCGFSVMATNLYVTRIISLGTLVSIYLSTSDEMLPILLSHGASIALIIRILLIKVVVGIVCGFLIDLIFQREENKLEDYHICEEEHCHCEEGIIKSSIRHTLNIFIFIFIITFVLNIIMDVFGNEILASIFNSNSFLSPILSGLVGLIPNCGSSVIVTELYLNGVIPLSSAIAGLLTGSGVALLVLFKSNSNFKENMKILLLVYGIGVISGLIIELLELI